MSNNHDGIVPVMQTFLKCHPMVNIVFFNQIWRSFTLKIPEGGHQVTCFPVALLLWHGTALSVSLCVSWPFPFLLEYVLEISLM